MGCETEVRIGGHEVSELSPFEQAMHFPELAMHGIDAVGDVPASDAVCIFGVDASSVAGDVLSDMSDELSDTPVSMVCDGRVPESRLRFHSPGETPGSIITIAYMHLEIPFLVHRCISVSINHRAQIFRNSLFFIGYFRVLTVRLELI